MFERYTEKARRVIFFARYEASQFGSPYIETEHLLLGLLRESRALVNRLLPQLREPIVRKQIEEHSPNRAIISTSVDLPLSNEAKRVLAYASEEAEQLKDQHIGSEHLLPSLLREEGFFSAQLLKELGGADLLALRSQIGQLLRPWEGGKTDLPLAQRSRAPGIEVHGARMDADFIRDALMRCREESWYWRKNRWKVVKVDGTISFDLGLAEDSQNFTLMRGGWKKDRCAVCRWPLLESSDPVHGTGYTNGRDWLCTECYEKFWNQSDTLPPTAPKGT